MLWTNDPTWEAQTRALGFDIDDPPQPASHGTSRRKVKGSHERHATIAVTYPDCDCQLEGRHAAIDVTQHTAKDAVNLERGMQPSSS